jgi:L-ribulose-5-phosphate 4-epimerase
MIKKYINYSQECKKQNIRLVEKKLSIQTFSNVSVRIDKNFFVIKPSGVPPKQININNCPIIRISNGKKVFGKYNPSTDTPTHQILYKTFSHIKSISHTHSKYATAWAQTGKSIPMYGTTHADYWAGNIPVTGFLKKSQLVEYEKNTGYLIVNLLKKLKFKSTECPGVIVAGHGPFCWGNTFDSAVDYSEMLEYISEMAYFSDQIKVKNKLPSHISKKHFERKFGKNRYYGQK